eukprot:4287317-Prymnesium_polylepis.1
MAATAKHWPVDWIAQQDNFVAPSLLMRVGRVAVIKKLDRIDLAFALHIRPQLHVRFRMVLQHQRSADVHGLARTWRMVEPQMTHPIWVIELRLFLVWAVRDLGPRVAGQRLDGVLNPERISRLVQVRVTGAQRARAVEDVPKTYRWQTLQRLVVDQAQPKQLQVINRGQPILTAVKLHAILTLQLQVQRLECPQHRAWSVKEQTAT